MKWSLGCLEALNQLFHVSLMYHKPSQSFVLSVWIAKSQKVASKYIANLVIEGDKRKLCFDGIKVSSVENVPSIDKCVEESGDFSLCLPISLAKNISMKKQMMDYLNVNFSFKKV